MVIDPRVLVDRDQEGMGIAGKGIWDRFADQRDGLGGGFLALLRAFVAAALLAAAGLMSLIIRVFRLFCLFCLFSEK